MSRFRLILTLLVLGVGTGMAAIHLRPQEPVQSHRIDSQNSAPAPSVSSRPLVESSNGADPGDGIVPAAMPPTVVVPDEPLFRNATRSPPLETSHAPAAQVTVRHSPAIDPIEPRLDQPPAAGPLAPASGTVAPAEEPIAPATAKTGTNKRNGSTRARTTSRPRSNRGTRSVESLFTNPLGRY